MPEDRLPQHAQQHMLSAGPIFWMEVVICITKMVLRGRGEGNPHAPPFLFKISILCIDYLEERAAK
jgi:hypothetical protein